MTLPGPLPYSWRVSRYEPILRSGSGELDAWTDHSDIGRSFNGLTLTQEEYLRVENAYVNAAIRFALEYSTELFRVAYVGQQRNGFALAPGQLLPRSDLAPVVRGNLRGVVDCAVESPDSALQIAFGYDLYMHVGAGDPCDPVIADVLRMGLYVEPGVPLAMWEADN